MFNYSTFKLDHLINDSKNVGHYFDSTRIEHVRLERATIYQLISVKNVNVVFTFVLDGFVYF
jgi:hypothetical protein